MGGPEVSERFKTSVRDAFGRTIILSGGVCDLERAERDLTAKKGDLVAFGRPFLANPDLVRRLQTKAWLNPPDLMTFYTPGPKGYVDYPTLA